MPPSDAIASARAGAPTSTSTDARALRLALFTDTFPPQVNGVSRTLERLVHAVQERGGQVRVFTTSDPEARASDAVVRFPSVPFWAYKEMRMSWPSRSAVRQRVRDFAPTLVHATTPFGVGLAGRHAALALGIPLVTSYHTSFSSYAGFYHLGALSSPGWRYLRWFHNSGRITFCPTQAIVDEVHAHGFTGTRVWSRGVDAQRFSPTWRSASLRAQMGVRDDTVVVTYVGRVAAEKGLDVAVRAVALAAEARPGRFVLACVGDGPYHTEVRRLAPPGSWLPGRLEGDALSAAYASGDIFLFPSATDTFGNVMLEAMASGLPVIGADVGPTRELVRDDRGLLAPAGDAVAFAARLVTLADDAGHLSRLRDGARAFAGTRSWTEVWDKLTADYLSVHARPS